MDPGMLGSSPLAGQIWPFPPVFNAESERDERVVYCRNLSESIPIKAGYSDDGCGNLFLAWINSMWVGSIQSVWGLMWFKLF